MQRRDIVAVTVGTAISLFALITAAVVNLGGTAWELPGLETYPLNTSREMFLLQWQGILLRSLVLLCQNCLWYSMIPIAACGLLRLSKAGSTSSSARRWSRIIWITVWSVPVLFLHGVIFPGDAPSLLGGIEGRIFECWSAGAEEVPRALMVFVFAIFWVPITEAFSSAIKTITLNLAETANSSASDAKAV